jgi:hypothetical protein
MIDAPASNLLPGPSFVESVRQRVASVLWHEVVLLSPLLWKFLWKASGNALDMPRNGEEDAKTDRKLSAEAI